MDTISDIVNEFDQVIDLATEALKEDSTNNLYTLEEVDQSFVKSCGSGTLLAGATDVECCCHLSCIYLLAMFINSSFFFFLFIYPFVLYLEIC